MRPRDRGTSSTGLAATSSRGVSGRAQEKSSVRREPLRFTVIVWLELPLVRTTSVVPGAGTETVPLWVAPLSVNTVM